MPMTMNTNRSGSDRRQETLTVESDRRSVPDRRNLVKDPDKTTGRLRMEPFFDNLSSDQLRAMLMICTKKTFEKNEIIFHIGEEPTHMFLLIKGKLKVMFHDGGESPVVTPTGMVGELGLLTGKPRLITVRTDSECTLLSFQRDEVFRLFEVDTSMWTTIQANVIRCLYERIHGDIETAETMRGVRIIEIV
jgi:CRP-like cAMP-binding protein